jgi:hypothetical protein
MDSDLGRLQCIVTDTKLKVCMKVLWMFSWDVRSACVSSKEHLRGMPLRTKSGILNVKVKFTL